MCEKATIYFYDFATFMCNLEGIVKDIIIEALSKEDRKQIRKINIEDAFIEYVDDPTCLPALYLYKDTTFDINPPHKEIALDTHYVVRVSKQFITNEVLERLNILYDRNISVNNSHYKTP